MKKIFIILFVFYLSFINCQHNFTEEEILNFFDRAMDTIIEKYANVTDDCGDTFSANLTFGVLFTNDDDFEKDLNNIKSNYSSNVIDLASDEDMENGLIDKENKILGIGDWGLGIGPNPQSPIPNLYFKLLFIINKIK